MRLKKLDMARVIVQALYNMPTLPAEDHHMVVRMQRRRLDTLRGQHAVAMRVLQQKINEGYL